MESPKSGGEPSVPPDLTGGTESHKETPTQPPGSTAQKTEAAPSPAPVSTDTVSWKDWIDPVTKLVGLFLGMCYVIGLLIVNSHLQRYGLSEFGLLRVEYAMAGASWFLLVVATGSSLKYMLYRIKLIKGFGSFLWVLLLILVWSNLLFAMVGYLSEWVLAGSLQWATWRCAAILVFQWMFGWGVIEVLRNIAQKRVVQPWWSVLPSPVGRVLARTQRDQVHSLLSILFSFLFALWLYSLYVYPYLSPTFGGGRPQEISMVVKPEEVVMIRALGFTVGDNRVTTPVTMIVETPDFLLLKPTNGKNPNVRAIKIRRDFVDSVLYLETRNDLMHRLFY
jgi:hypothetical protein